MERTEWGNIIHGDDHLTYPINGHRINLFWTAKYKQIREFAHVHALKSTISPYLGRWPGEAVLQAQFYLLVLGFLSDSSNSSIHILCRTWSAVKETATQVPTGHRVVICPAYEITEACILRVLCRCLNLKTCFYFSGVELFCQEKWELCYLSYRVLWGLTSLVPN